MIPIRRRHQAMKSRPFMHRAPLSCGLALWLVTIYIPSITAFRYDNITNPSNSSTTSTPSPSAAPTGTCHDVSSYRSPIHNLSCASHDGTDCLEWRHVGLNASGLVDLLQACPVSCRVDCASSVQHLQWNQTLLLSNVSSYLSPVTTWIVETVLLGYWTDYLDAKLPQGRVVLYKPLLVRQAVYEPTELAHRRLSHNSEDQSVGRMQRRLQQVDDESLSPVTLKLTLLVEGVSINLPLDTIKYLVGRAINSPGLTQALKMSGDESLVYAVATTAGQPTRNTDQSPPGTDGNPKAFQPWEAFLVSAAILGVVAALVAYCCWRRRMAAGRVYQEQSTDKGLSSAANSRTKRLQDLSFDTIPHLNSSPPRTLDSHDHRNDSSTTSYSDFKKPNAENAGPINATQFTLPTAAFIPPMIVIDHIEASEGESQAPSPDRNPLSEQNVVRLEATPDFRRALQCRDTNMDHALYLDWKQASLDEKASSFHSQMGGADKELSQDDGSADLDELVHAIRDHSFASSIGRNASNESSLDELLGDSKRSLATTFHTALEQEEQDISWTYAGQSFICLDDVLETSLVRMQDGAEEPAHSHSSFVSAKETTTDNVPGSYSIGRSQRALQHSYSLETPSRTQLESELPESRAPLSVSKRLKAYCGRRSRSLSNIDLPGGQIEFAVQAPSKGKLGLDVQCLASQGPVVMAVKDYSPLLGQVMPGDRLVSIGGVKTRELALPLILKLLNGDRSLRWSPTFRLVFVRESNVSPPRP